MYVFLYKRSFQVKKVIKINWDCETSISGFIISSYSKMISDVVAKENHVLDKVRQIIFNIAFHFKIYTNQD